MAIDDGADRRETASFPAEPSAVAAARDHVRSCLAGAPGTVVDDACLLTSELAGNAVVHARTPFRVTVTSAGETVRIDVSDRGGGFPAIADPQPEIGGLGLRLVDRVAARWGTSTTGDETVVWFELGG